MKQRDLCLLQVPFTDMSAAKIRPAIVVSNDSLNRKSDDVVMVPVTSVIKDQPYSVSLNQTDLSSGKLIKPSRIRVDKILAVDKKIIIKKIGVIDHKKFIRIKKEILGLF